MGSPLPNPIGTHLKNNNSWFKDLNWLALLLFNIVLISFFQLVHKISNLHVLGSTITVLMKNVPCRST